MRCKVHFGLHTASIAFIFNAGEADLTSSMVSLQPVAVAMDYGPLPIAFSAPKLVAVQLFSASRLGKGHEQLKA